MPRLSLALALLVANVAHAGKAEVHALFDTYVDRSNAFDPSWADLFAEDATLAITRRDATGDGEELAVPLAALRDQIPDLMERARAADERSDWAKPTIRKTDAGWRVTAPRTSLSGCYVDDAFALDLREEAGALRIVRLETEIHTDASCAAADLAATLTTLQRQIAPHLPLALDEVTWLEDVRVEGDTLVYVQRLDNVAVDDPDAGALAPVLAGLAIENACGAPAIREVLTSGGGVRFAWRHAGGEPYVSSDVRLADCP